jgi:Permeases of the drug/metabolite transporter (DMT) superfamily
MQANLYALGAIALWASLAALAVSLAHVPPFLLTGIALVIGSVPAWPLVWRNPSVWRIPPRTLALGVYGLFAYHFLLFIALRHAPPVEANLVNYLWPLLIVVLAPVLLPGVVLRPAHVLAALLGFGGAALAIAGGRALSGALSWGYVPALASAFIWASYSLLTKRVAAFPTTAIGLFGLVSGLLSLLCHVLLEPSTALQARDWALLAVLGLGPLGASLYLWDKALTPRRRTAHRHPELPHTARLHGVAGAGERPPVHGQHRAGDGAHRERGGAGHACPLNFDKNRALALIQ